MDDNKMLYAVYYDPSLSHKYMGASAPGCILPPMNFRKGSNGAPAPSKKRKAAADLEYSASLGKFAVERPVRGPSLPRRVGDEAANAVEMSGAGHPSSLAHLEGPGYGHDGSVMDPRGSWAGAMEASGSGTSVKIQFQDGQAGHHDLPTFPTPYNSFSSNAAYSTLKLEPIIDPLLSLASSSSLSTQAHQINNGVEDPRLTSIFSSLRTLGNASLTPLDLLLFVLDSQNEEANSNAEIMRARNDFYDQRNHANIHALFTRIQADGRLRQRFPGVLNVSRPGGPKQE
ncbi:hypothetical protein DFP72DRAFT_1120439 [Ephemerocybe angulata]|uniref:Uncharacterized protein n=1 Tax=Ephemerocybe angulata TaxID=980116 RepID=A0A8H6MDQ1_9AGAR|nr:hypothetical protein DFP72DRAFT_1120439 [Tulosesus angulatus]